MVASELQKAFGNPVLCVDIDGIARGPVWNAFADALGTADLALYRRDERRVHRRVRAGAVGFGATPAAKQFADALCRSIHLSLRIEPRYHIDQTLIVRLAEAMEARGAIEIADMPRSLTDPDFEEGSLIWTAKGPKKDMPAFKEALDRYR